MAKILRELRYKWKMAGCYLRYFWKSPAWLSKVWRHDRKGEDIRQYDIRDLEFKTERLHAFMACFTIEKGEDDG